MKIVVEATNAELSLSAHPVSVGRAISNDICFASDFQVSSKHFTCTDTHLTDFSTNGTIINDQRVEKGVPVAIHAGDRILIGTSALRIVDSEVENKQDGDANRKKLQVHLSDANESKHDNNNDTHHPPRIRTASEADNFVPLKLSLPDGREFKLHPPTFAANNGSAALASVVITVGRDPTSTIALPETDRLASFSHCTITNGVIVDPRSTNGTLLNGVKLSHSLTGTELQVGDQICIGDAVMIVRAETDNSQFDWASLKRGDTVKFTPRKSGSIGSLTPAAAAMATALVDSPNNSTPLKIEVDDGREFPLMTPGLRCVVTIGRNPEATISLPGDTGISFNHCSIVDGGLVDTGSTNGTHLNGVKIEPRVMHRLAADDEIRLGNSSVLRVVASVMPPIEVARRLSSASPHFIIHPSTPSTATASLSTTAETTETSEPIPPSPTIAPLRHNAYLPPISPSMPSTTRVLASARTRMDDRNRLSHRGSWSMNSPSHNELSAYNQLAHKIQGLEYQLLYGEGLKDAEITSLRQDLQMANTELAQLKSSIDKEAAENRQLRDVLEQIREQSKREMTDAVLTALAAQLAADALLYAADCRVKQAHDEMARLLEQLHLRSQCTHHKPPPLPTPLISTESCSSSFKFPQQASPSPLHHNTPMHASASATAGTSPVEEFSRLDRGGVLLGSPTSAVNDSLPPGASSGDISLHVAAGGKRHPHRCGGKWIADSLRPTCHRCKTHFSFFTRRHHCRCCYDIFCSRCSDIVNEVAEDESEDATPRSISVLRKCKDCQRSP